MRRLKEQLKALPVEEEMVSLPHKVKAIGQIECLTLTVGAVPVECAALVVGECVCVKMKLQKHVKIKIELLLFCSKSVSLVLGREEDVFSRAVLAAPGSSSAVPMQQPPCLPAGASACPRLIMFPSGVTQSLCKQGFI